MENFETNENCILLVDDENALLEVMMVSLQDAGYKCISASNVSTALKALQATPTIDVIVSDIRMPGADGLELLRIVKAKFPERGWLQTLFITGHP